ncbi:hypothetical protein TRIUR3_11361 [Triticum urartu]|uniref:Gnk2-homologous domain-containing protein n=1 Tax=Triticum urartu TaxID=4572 RepID=M7ZG25_TRIUA|nr:hypothetical protein TRIUR3_11361 [Triticum urartu]
MDLVTFDRAQGKFMSGNGANNELATDTVHLRCGGGGTMTTIYRLGYCARDIKAADCGLCVAHTVYRYFFPLNGAGELADEAAGCRRSIVAVVSCLLASILLLHLLLLTPSTAAAVSLDATASPWLWQQGRRGPAARRLLLAAQPRPTTAVGGTETNEFHVKGGTLPAAANGKPGEVGFDASMRKFPKSGSNKNHN